SGAYWVYACCQSLHRIGSEELAEQRAGGPAVMAMRECEGSVVLLDKKAVTSSRLWCAVEQAEAALASMAKDAGGAARCRFKVDLATAVSGSAMLIVDGPTVEHREGTSMGGFPVTLLEACLATDVARCQVTEDGDRSRLLGKLSGHAPMEGQLTEPPASHAGYAAANAHVRSIFAPAGLLASLAQGDSESLRKFGASLKLDALRRKLYLDLSGMGDALSRRALAEVARSLPPALEELDLNCSGCDLLDDAALEDLSKSIGSLRSLQSLRLNFRGCKGIGPAGVLCLARALSSQDLKLLDLDLAGTGLKAGAQALVSPGIVRSVSMAAAGALRGSAKHGGKGGYPGMLVTVEMLRQQANGPPNAANRGGHGPWIRELRHSGVLVCLLAHPDSRLREGAAAQLGRVASPGMSRHSAALEACARDESAAVREATIVALGRLCCAGVMDSSEAPATAVAERLCDPGRDVRRAAVLVLLKLPIEGISCYAWIIAILAKHGSQDLRRKADKALQVTDGTSRANALAQVLIHKNAEIRALAARSMSKLGASAAAHADVLAACLGDKEAPVREAAAVALASLGAAVLPHSVTLAARLGDGARSVQAAAVQAMLHLPAASILPEAWALSSSLRHCCTELHKRADSALEALGEERRCLAYVGLLGHSEPLIRE
ncbi:unnamed protein product, partial [Polarella glacialis]